MTHGGEWKNLGAAWRAEHAEGRACVLATLVRTEGSTYRRPGAMALVTLTGRCLGLLSGGCLEADIVARAEGVFEDGVPRLAVYDLRSAEDLVFGLGLGCEGKLEIWLERLDPDGASPFDLPAGSFLEKRYQDENGRERVFAAEVPTTRRALIVGAGVDARPVAALLDALGWAVVVADRREGVLAEFPTELVAGKRGFVPGESIPVQSAWFDEVVRGFDAIVLMNHHLDTDAWFLGEVARRLPAGGAAEPRVRYLGLLGPARRRDKLLGAIPEAARHFPGIIRAPAGLDLGGDGPEAVALSIAAEIHAAFHHKEAGSLSEKKGPIHDR